MFTIGSDNEVFFQKDKQPAMAIGYVGGTKEEPRAFACCTVQEDNVAAEYNTEPVADEDSWVYQHKTMLEGLSALAEETGHELAIVPSMHFAPEVLKSEPAAMVLGCLPDIDIYGTISEPPSPFTTLRTAGAHIHIGADKVINDVELAVAALDTFVGRAALEYDKGGQERLQMYGGLGKYRAKSYGVEYRTLSNFWLQSEYLLRWVYRNTVRAVEEMHSITVGDAIKMPFNELVDKYSLEVIDATG